MFSYILIGLSLWNQDLKFNGVNQYFFPLQEWEMSLPSAEKENETRKSALKMSFGGGAAECVTYVLMCQDGVLMIKSS